MLIKIAQSVLFLCNEFTTAMQNSFMYMTLGITFKIVILHLKLKRLMFLKVSCKKQKNSFTYVIFN